MRPLTAGDPPAIGGHRLLGRLGSGGMGVVYLARSPGGALVALKVIRAEHAADPAFRARFEREARAASRISGRWTTPVAAAAPQAVEPWLATAFVPGPSLSEAVSRYGPLPEPTVRVLGERLAEALIEVHAAGLVHRDVKPGNVLLALDGPRLIDFGIARAVGATALTATDMVIGSPGYLSPEQAQAGRAGEIGPPSDIFSLGCVLAYAASGRRPFGTGTPAAVLFRTVHEEPELDDVPGPLLSLVTGCLAKDPDARPTADVIRAELAGTVSRPGEWLPSELPRLIAERSARVLELPDPDPDLDRDPDRDPDPDADRDPDPGPREPTRTQNRLAAAPNRRRFLALGGSAAATAAIGGGIAAYLASRPDRGGDGGQVSSGPLPRHTVGLQADLSGGGKAVGRAQERGARLAVEEFNARKDRPFELTLKVLDDGGEPTRARAAAAQLVADRAVQAVIGPSTVAAAEAVAAQYQKALLPVLAVSVSTDRVSSATNRAFFQLSPDNSVLTLAMVHYLTVVAKADRTAVVEDLAAGKAGWELANSMQATPPSEGVTTVHQVAATSDDFGPAVAALMAARAQGVVFAGTSPHRAALCARALQEAGFKGAPMANGTVLEPAFLSGAGTAAEGWVFSTAFADAAGQPGAEHFVAEFKKRFGVRQVDRYALEAYDALHLVAQGMSALGKGGVERGAMVRRLRELSYKGLAKTIAFEPLTRVMPPQSGQFLHRVEGGRVRFLGHYAKVRNVGS